MAIRNHKLATLLRDKQGNVLPIAAVAMMVTATIVGGGVDLSRAYRVQSRLQYACDAGVLAARKTVSTTGFDQTVQTTGANYFNANFDRNGLSARNVVFGTASQNNGQTITGTATATVDSAVVKVIGMDTFNLSATCSSSMGVGNSDVTMVLDVTGSMDDPITSGGSSKIVMLRAAMKSFYDTVAASTAGSNARVRYGFVPYSSGVNVGALVYGANPSYIADSWPIQSRRGVMKPGTGSLFSHWSAPVDTTDSGYGSTTTVSTNAHSTTEYSSQSACTGALPADTAWSNYGSPSTGSPEVDTTSTTRTTTIRTTQEQRMNDYYCQYDTVQANLDRSDAPLFALTSDVREATRPYLGNTLDQVIGWVSDRLRAMPLTWKDRDRDDDDDDCRRNCNTRSFYRQYVSVKERESYSDQIATETAVYTTTNEVFDYFQYERVTYNTSVYKTFAPATTYTRSNGAAVTSTWTGCIEERETVSDATFTYVAGTGITPSGAKDLDIDSAPTGDATTKWGPMWPEVSYYRTTSGGGLTNAASSRYGSKSDAYCPKAAQLLQTMTEGEFDAYADGLNANGYTYHDIGMIWGARLASPQGIFSSNVNTAPSNGGQVARHLIFMTDGQMMNVNTLQTPYGIEYHDRRVTDDGSTDEASRRTSRYKAICEAVKAKGIRVWVIAFSTGLTTDLQNCASANSSFTANSSSQLNEAFQTIARQVGELRITQ